MTVKVLLIKLVIVSELSKVLTAELTFDWKIVMASNL